jgi:hypothetical protein
VGFCGEGVLDSASCEMLTPVAKLVSVSKGLHGVGWYRQRLSANQGLS